MRLVVQLEDCDEEVSRLDELCHQVGDRQRASKGGVIDVSERCEGAASRLVVERFQHVSFVGDVFMCHWREGFEVHGSFIQH